MPKTISAIIKSVSKIYLGQLVEEAKIIQLEELRDSSLSESEIEAMELGPIEPHQLQEARRRLLQRGELIPEKPKPMFRR